MTLPTTEAGQPGAPIDMRSPHEAVALLLDGQSAAIDAVRAASRAISNGARTMAAAVRSENCLHYAAAGSSGLMALADASELRGTFGIPTDKIHIHMAGGVPTDGHMPGDTEDDEKAVEVMAQSISKNDVVIVLTASGTTPFALAIARAAKAKGAIIIGIANNPGTPLLELVNEPICIATPSEVIAGSTRLGAGTAQKATLNLMSTLMGVELGHVYHGEMVNVIADNAKLVQRAVGMVSRIADVTEDNARAAIAQTRGAVKAAILVASGSSPEKAKILLEQNKGHLGPCLSSLRLNQTISSN